MWGKISLDEIIKSINSQTHNKSTGTDCLTVVFQKHISKWTSSYPWCLRLWGNMTAWVLKTKLQTTGQYITILKNWLKKNKKKKIKIDVIIGEKQIE